MQQRNRNVSYEWGGAKDGGLGVGSPLETWLAIDYRDPNIHFGSYRHVIQAEKPSSLTLLTEFT